jgi:GNAT superfamily N-acetyltransferase
MILNCNNTNISIIKEATNLDDFKCGDYDLEKYLKKDAFYDVKNKLSVTWLVHMDDVIIGFFTLANASINTSLINVGDGECEYPYQSYPALKIARMATHTDYKNRGVGRAMLIETVAKAEIISHYSGCRFIVVDSKKKSVGFYQKYGFRIPRWMANKIEARSTIPLYIDLNKVSIGNIK